MSALAAAPPALPPALPGPFAEPPRADALEPNRHTVHLVRALVRDLLSNSDGFHRLEPGERVALAKNLVRVGSYLAECVRDDWC